MASRRPPPPSAPPPPAPAHAYKLALLRHLAQAALLHSHTSALFFAERLHALEPAAEPSAHLVAACLIAAGKHSDALWILRQPVTFVPASSSDPQGADDPFLAGRRWPQASTSAGRLTRPAAEASVRCARLYGQACLALKRDKEGREALARVLQPGTPLAPATPAHPDPDVSLLVGGGAAAWLAPLDEGAVVELEMARLACRGGDYERAVQSFRNVVVKAPTCWEAIEALCALGMPPDIDGLLPLKPRSHPPSVHSAPLQQQPRPLATANAVPAPLGPSQTAAVNAGLGAYGAAARTRSGLVDGSGGLFTPTEIAVKPGGLFGANAKGKGKEVGTGLFGATQAPPGLRRTGSGRYADMTVDLSAADECVPSPRLRDRRSRDLTLFHTSIRSSFDASFYPTAPLSFAPSNAAIPPASRQATSAAGSLFTPPAGSLPAATAPGVKRTRAGTIAPASVSTAAPPVEDDAARPGRRIVRGEGKSRRGDAASASSTGVAGPAAPATRRSSRLSGHAAAAAAAAGGVAMAVSRSQTSATGRGAGAGAAGGGARDKKRNKGGAGPSVLSDAGSEPISHSSSPAPSSPANGNGSATAAMVDPVARDEAQDYVLRVLRSFARAAVAAARYECKGAIEALAELPVEQMRTWRALVMLAKTHYEMLNYAQVRLWPLGAAVPSG